MRTVRTGPRLRTTRSPMSLTAAIVTNQLDRAMETFEATQRQLLVRLQKDPLLAKRVILLKSIRGVGEVTALTWALEVSDPHRFSSVANAVSYCGLTSALISSADKQQRAPIGSTPMRARLHSVSLKT